MKYYWITSTIEMKTASHQEYVCACKDDGGWGHADNRRSLTFDNLRKLVVVYCNNAE